MGEETLCVYCNGLPSECAVYAGVRDGEEPTPHQIRMFPNPRITICFSCNELRDPILCRTQECHSNFCSWCGANFTTMPQTSDIPVRIPS